MINFRRVVLDRAVNVLSLYDGCSMGRVALERAGIPIKKYYASEIDPYPIKVSQKNYPDIIHVGDVKYVEKTNDSPNFDLLIGGSPCQAFSFASKGRLNFDDPRSKLFFEYVRILKEFKPKYFLFENVRMKQECQDIISEYLGVKPIAINSRLVSAQNRLRLYWTNIPFQIRYIEENLHLSNVKDYKHCLECMEFMENHRNGFTVDVIAHILKGILHDNNIIEDYHNWGMHG
tara:strand:- start:5267 stop:5962 length:696 start_codon:yes stop_codon:yes gene_type:complete